MISLKNDKRLRIIFALLTVIVVILYTSIWFYVTSQLENRLKNLQYKTDNISFIFSDVQISGFPFYITAKFKDIKFNYNKNNKAASFAIDFISDTLEVKSNILFSTFSIKFPKESLIDIFSNKKIFKLKIIADDTHYFEVNEKSLTNIPLIIAYLKDQNIDLFKDIGLAKARYTSTNLRFIDAVTNKEIFNNSSNLELKISYKKDNISGLALKTNHNIEFIDNEFVGHKFKRLISHIDIATKVKPYDHILAFTAADFNIVELVVDNSSIKLKGTSEINKDKTTYTDMSLKLTNFQAFIKNMLEQGKLSQGKLDVLKECLKQTTGDEKADNIEIKIYNSKDNELRIGNIDSANFKSYIHRFIVSE